MCFGIFCHDETFFKLSCGYGYNYLLYVIKTAVMLVITKAYYTSWQMPLDIGIMVLRIVKIVLVSERLAGIGIFRDFF